MQEVGDEVSRPAEKDLLLQREKADSLLKDAILEEDGSALPTSLVNRSRSLAGPSGLCVGPPQQAAGKSRPQPKAKSRANPIVLATQLRTRTVKDYREVDRLLKKSADFGMQVLQKDALEVHGSQEEVDSDFTLNLLRDRLELMRLAKHGSEDGPESLRVSQDLFAKCLRDPYLKDLSSTFLSSESGCMSYGRVTYMRNTVMDLQSSTDAVQDISNNVKNALALLKKIATAVQSEAETWKSNIALLHKVRLQENVATRTDGSLSEMSGKYVVCIVCSKYVICMYDVCMYVTDAPLTPLC